jgi:GNAT superfamily N-acetyltransferase
VRQMDAKGSFASAESDPDLSNRLVEQHRKFLETEFPGWGTHQAQSLARQRANGGLALHQWRSGDGGTVGLVWLQAVSPDVRVHGVWIEPTSPSRLSELLKDLARERQAPVAAISDVLPGLRDEDEFFRPRGYWHRAKVLMRYDGGGRVPSGSRPGQVRPIETRDLPSVVDVYVRAYADRPGEFWTWSASNARQEAESDVLGHQGAGGAWASNFLPDASFVWEEGHRIVGAVLVEAGRSGAPFVEDLVVDPDHHRRGIGRALLESSIARLTQEGPRTIELCAIRFGAPYRLYTRLGFADVPPPIGRFDGYWIHGASPF